MVDTFLTVLSFCPEIVYELHKKNLNAVILQLILSEMVFSTTDYG
jgi:hypothetical protein